MTSQISILIQSKITFDRKRVKTMEISKQKRIVVFFCNLFFIVCCLSSSNAAEPTKVVVVPLDSSSTANLAERFVNVETSHTWDCPPTSTSLSFNAECPANCVAIGGACTAKNVADSTDVNVTGGNFIKTNWQLSKYNAYQCWMYALSCNDPADPPIGYAQVICYCNQ